MVTYYHVLGLTPTASQQQIRAAYHRITTLASNNSDAHIDRMLVNEAYGNLSSSENQRVYDEWLQDSNPLGNRSLAFLNTETEPAVAAGRKLVDTTTPSPPQCLSTASSPRHSPAASRDARNRSAREEGCEEGDERGRQGRRGGGEESHGSGKEGGAGMSRTNPGGERRGEMSAEDQDVNKTKAKGKGKGKK